jgi:hypothetical protein
MPRTRTLPIGSVVDVKAWSIRAHAVFRTVLGICGDPDTDHRNPLNSVRGMQAADGPNSSQFE